MEEMNRKLIYLAIALLIILTLIYFFAPKKLLYDITCQNHYNVSCYEPGNISVKMPIPCSSDDDCSFYKMKDFCSPANVNFLKCIEAKYYCDSDGFCKGCLC